MIQPFFPHCKRKRSSPNLRLFFGICILFVVAVIKINLDSLKNVRNEKTRIKYENSTFIFLRGNQIVTVFVGKWMEMSSIGFCDLFMTVLRNREDSLHGNLMSNSVTDIHLHLKSPIFAKSHKSLVINLNLSELQRQNLLLGNQVSLLNVIFDAWRNSSSNTSTYRESNWLLAPLFGIEDLFFGGGTKLVICMLHCLAENKVLLQKSWDKNVLISCVQSHKCVPMNVYNIDHRISQRHQNGFQVFTYFLVYNRSNMCSQEMPGAIGATSSADLDETHIAYAGDKAQYVGVAASINSVLMSSSFRDKIFLHLFVCQDCQDKDRLSIYQLEELVNLVKKYSANNLQIHYFKSGLLDPYINHHNKGRIDLQSPNNYIRFFLAYMLPTIQYILWLDCDTIVTKDIVPFMQGAVDSEKVLSAFPYNTSAHVNITHYRLFSASGVKVSSSINPRFHAGVVVFNLDQWRKQNVTGKILEISSLNREHKWITKVSSQGPLTLLFSGDKFHYLNSNLYTGGLGWNDGLLVRCSSLILHWNGNKKPWPVEKERMLKFLPKKKLPSNNVYRYIWQHYAVANLKYID